MKTYDLYGCVDSELETVRQTVEELLRIAMEKHESSYRGGDYYRHGADGSENFILQSNYNTFEGEWTKEQYKEYPFLLYVNETSRSGDIEKKLGSTSKVKLLQRKTL